LPPPLQCGPLPDTDTPVVLVDAENVRRSTWPNIAPDEFVQLACDWAQRKGVRAVVVFDGPGPESGDTAGCDVVGTTTESADDWIARRAAELRAAGTSFWLVTSDRELRRLAGDGAERTIGGGSFAGELRPT
jgi:predicted RNA-binding protein with PIN domain